MLCVLNAPMFSSENMWSTEHVSSKTDIVSFLWTEKGNWQTVCRRLHASVMYQMYISNLKKDFGFVTAVLYTYTELCSSVYSEIRWKDISHMDVWKLFLGCCHDLSGPASQIHSLTKWVKPALLETACWFCVWNSLAALWIRSCERHTAMQECF